MKRFMIFVIAVFVLAVLFFVKVPAFAEEVVVVEESNITEVTELPPTNIWENITLNAGVYYSLKESAINHTETITLVNFKEIVNLEGGYAGDSDESDHKIVLALSVNIDQLALKNYMSIPILDLIALKPALYLGLGNINMQDLSSAKLDYGLGFTCVSFKF